MGDRPLRKEKARMKTKNAEGRNFFDVFKSVERFTPWLVTFLYGVFAGYGWAYYVFQVKQF